MKDAVGPLDIYHRCFHDFLGANNITNTSSEDIVQNFTENSGTGSGYGSLSR